MLTPPVAVVCLPGKATGLDWGSTLLCFVWQGCEAANRSGNLQSPDALPRESG